MFYDTAQFIKQTVKHKLRNNKSINFLLTLVPHCEDTDCVYETLNRWVFTADLNNLMELLSRIADGRSFHNHGPRTLKARPPYLTRFNHFQMLNQGVMQFTGTQFWSKQIFEVVWTFVIKDLVNKEENLKYITLEQGYPVKRFKIISKHDPSSLPQDDLCCSNFVPSAACTEDSHVRH